MRSAVAIAMILGCGSAPEPPARLEPVTEQLPANGPDTAYAFDLDNSLILMDGASGLRRLVGDRLFTVAGGSQFTFGTIGVDRDGVLLIGGQGLLKIARLEPDDRLVELVPAPPTSFTRIAGTPSGAYHILPFGAATTLMLPAGGTQWIDSTRRLDRTLRATTGAVYAIEDGDIVELGADDAPSVVASCAEIAGGVCADLAFTGEDGAGHLHLVLPGLPTIHILDPAGSYREVALPGGLVIEAVATGPVAALVLAVDPARQNERSLWLLRDGEPALRRFASLGVSAGDLVRVLVDRAGELFLVHNTTLERVVLL